MSFKDKLVQIRTVMKLSQTEFADRCGVSIWAVRDYEQGKRKDPPLSFLLAISKGVEMSLEVFKDVTVEETE
jgi:transcriptional regulator with XRE-family HTH domain